MEGGNQTEATCPEIRVRAVSPEQRLLLRLTIIFHPDLERVGDVAEFDVFSGDEFELSRSRPVFAAPRGAQPGESLGDRYITRQGVVFSWLQDQLLLRIPSRGNSLLLDGVVLRDYVQLDESRLRSGVSLELARRIVLNCQLAPALGSPEVPMGMIGESLPIQELRRQLRGYACSSAPILLLGESGSGKELVARAVHALGDRAGSSLVAVNMAAVPSELAAAELFGVRRGAFTGADRDTAGYFGEADGGTLFMDEIGLTPPAAQGQLLRVLESGEVQVTGGGVRQVDVRVISATDASLDPEGREGFSSALRHRLGALEVAVPSLRERREDVGVLAVHFLREYALESGIEDQLSAIGESPETVVRWAALLAAMLAYNWPGNVRELRNICRQLILGSVADGALTVPRSVFTALSAGPVTGGGLAPETDDKLRYRWASRLTDEEVRETMASVDWEVARAARELNVSRPALYKRIEAVPDIRLVSDIPIGELQDIFRETSGDPGRGARLLQVSRSALQRRWRALELI